MMSAGPDLRTKVATGRSTSLYLANPVMASAGTLGSDGYGGGLPEEFPLGQLGAVVMKSTTLQPRVGNPEPQVVRLENGWLNSIGLANPGIDAVLREKAPAWATWEVPVILSVAAERVDGFRELAARADGTPGIAALEVNISCPNVDGGLDFGQDPGTAAEVVRAVRGATSLPVLVKLTPNVTDVVRVACSAEEAGADALTLINTLVGLGVDPESRRPLLGNVLGGVSGPAIKPVGLAMVYRVSRSVHIPVVGVGGVTTGHDAVEYLLAGASAVQVGSGALGRPDVYLRVLAGIVDYLEANDVRRVGDLVGGMQVPLTQP